MVDVELIKKMHGKGRSSQGAETVALILKNPNLPDVVKTPSEPKDSVRSEE